MSEMDIWSENILVDKDEGWFVGAQHSAVFHVDFRTQEYELLSILPSDELYGYEKYECCDKIDKVLYIFPRHIDGNVLLIDLKGKLIQEIHLPNPEKKDINVVGTCVYNDKIYVMALGLHKIFVLDLKNNTVIKDYEIYKEVEITDQNGNMIRKGENIYCTTPDSHIIYKLSLKDDRLDSFTIHGIEKGIHSFETAGDIFWITSKSKCIYLWDEVKKSVVQFNAFPKEFGRYKFDQDHHLYLDTDTKFFSEGFFLKGVFLNGYLWVVPCCENKILYLDMITLEIKVLDLTDEEEDAYTWEENEIKVKFCMCYVRENRYIGVYSFKNKNIFEIDVQSFKMERKDFSIRKEDMERLHSEKMACDIRNCRLVNEEDMDLFFYLKNDGINRINLYKDRNIGSSIHKYLATNH